MSSALGNISTILGLGPRKMTEQQKLHRILGSAMAQRAELHLVFGQRLMRATPIRGRFVSMQDHSLHVALDVGAVDDAWQHEPCSAYFSVRCAELSGSYAFATRIIAHKSKQGITLARLVMPAYCTNRQVRRFERLAPEDGMVQRMAVWNLQKLQEKLARSSTDQQRAALRIMTRMQEPMPLSALLPQQMQALGPADYQLTQQVRGCQLVNVSAGGARLVVSREQAQSELYNESDNLLLLLVLSRAKQPPMLLSLAGSCTAVLGASHEQDVRMRFIYWNRCNLHERANWAPVSLRGVLPLYEWVSQGLGIDDSKPKGIETKFDAGELLVE